MRPDESDHPSAETYPVGRGPTAHNGSLLIVQRPSRPADITSDYLTPSTRSKSSALQPVIAKSYGINRILRAFLKLIYINFLSRLKKSRSSSL
jgi:hypothetical protein